MVQGWRVRYGTFAKACARFSELAGTDIQQADVIHQEAFVKRFELVVETTKKMLKEYLREQGSAPEVLESPKSVMREAFRCGCVVDGQVWVRAIDVRGKAAHLYKDKIRAQTVAFAQKDFWPAAEALRLFLKERLEL